MRKHLKESDETKIKILNAAKKEFANKGFNGARMSSIASLAGVNQALLHYHFENKENLYRSIFQISLSDLPSSLSERLSKETDSWSPQPDLKLCIAIYIMISLNMNSHDDDLHRIFAREMAEGKGLLHEFIKKYTMPNIFLFESIIKEGINAGIFETSNTMMFSLNIVSFINHFTHGENFFMDTEIYNSLYKNKKEKLYNFLVENSFKALKPTVKELPIPVLDKTKKARLDLIVKETINHLDLKLTTNHKLEE